MILASRPTPGRLAGCPGVLLFLALTAVGGCDAIGGGETLQLEDAEVRLRSGSRIREVRVGGAGASDSIAPSTVTADPGDVVRFEVTDHRTHALAFDADALGPAARTFLEETDQLRGPPLVNEGTAWVVSLEGAPPGRYPFFCRSHRASGLLLVTGDAREG